MIFLVRDSLRAFSLILLFTSHQQPASSLLLSPLTTPTSSFAFHRRFRDVPHPSVLTLSCADTGTGGSSSGSSSGSGRERRISSNSNGNLNSDSSHAQGLISGNEKTRVYRTDQAQRRLEKAARREDRIAVLEKKETLSALTNAERAELTGLLEARGKFVEQYDPASFSEEHLEFKRLHNEAFLGLANYCHRKDDQTTTKSANSFNVFFLDGPNGGTASHLINFGGLDPSQCFVANRHLSTCQALRVSGGGQLPDENLIHASAVEALSMDTATITTRKGESSAASFAHIDFTAYYFDGCGGFVPHVIEMMTAALLRDAPCINPIAVGFSLTGGTKSLVEKELEVSRALATIAKTRGMRTTHVLDDPVRYGIPTNITKTQGGTFTSWVLLEKE